jgi:pentatricopeptide repeat protein
MLALSTLATATLQACCVCAGGAEEGKALMQMLRDERSLLAFAAAVRTLPKGSPLVWKVLDLLCTGAAGSDAWLRPTYGVAAALLDRAERDELGARVDDVIQRLRGAGLRMHYSLWLRWAGCHVATGSVQGVRRVMRLLEEAEGPAAVTAHFYVFLTKAYCHRGRWKEAEQLPDEMSQRGMLPSEHVYRAVIWCCGRHHRAGALPCNAMQA